MVVLPDQPNQPWYAAVARMLVKKPVLVSARNNLLCLPQLPEERHRLVKLSLIICEISGVASKSRDFWTWLFQLCAPCGALGLPHTYKDAEGMLTEGILIIDTVSLTVSKPLNFWATLLNSGPGFDAICVARSALSFHLVLKDGVLLGQQKLVIRFIKAVYEMKPALPRYSNTWSVELLGAATSTQ